MATRPTGRGGVGRRPAAPTRLAVALGLGLLPVGCGDPADDSVDPDQVDAVEAPRLGACRMLTVADLAEQTNATVTVPCSERHTAQTYAVGDLPADLRDADRDSAEVGAFAYDTCSTKLQKFLGADESLAMRTIVSWAWFRPSARAWDKGARWYRCDAVGGGDHSLSLAALPSPSAEGMLQGRPDDRWMVCAQGASVSESPKIACSQPHDWRAVTTIKVGEPNEAYPGDQEVEITTRDFCSDSVGAWLNYPVDFEYGYTWFHQDEWDAGNRRSVCWAKTSD
ncbi:septum formation family protein [Nocardioides sp. R-C-SC26]|uniref:septum formation family protein n=1 Tax=Nocardioides sp. R-C-SC26 TaxID=2870414 RepID=UPI001E5794D7|nr:septum formation family protein [Nocardioides sp. R-C-SC26]